MDSSAGTLLECKAWGCGTKSNPVSALEIENGGPNIKNCVLDGQSVTSLQQQQQASRVRKYELEF